MEKLTKETKIWTAVLLLGMLILAVVRAVIAISQMPPMAGVEVGPSLYIMTAVGGLRRHITGNCASGIHQ